MSESNDFLEISDVPVLMFPGQREGENAFFMTLERERVLSIVETMEVVSELKQERPYVKHLVIDAGPVAHFFQVRPGENFDSEFLDAPSKALQGSLLPELLSGKAYDGNLKGYYQDGGILEVESEGLYIKIRTPRRSYYGKGDDIVSVFVDGNLIARALLLTGTEADLEKHSRWLADKSPRTTLMAYDEGLTIKLDDRVKKIRGIPEKALETMLQSPDRSVRQGALRALRDQKPGGPKQGPKGNEKHDAVRAR